MSDQTGQDDQVERVDTREKTDARSSASSNGSGGVAVQRRRWRWISIGIGAVVIVVALGVVGFREWMRPATTSLIQIADVSSERLLALGSTVGFAAEHDTHAWLGLPYARPPVDALRWKAPRPPEAWADTFDALGFGPPCVQLSSPFGGVASDDPDGFVGSEDCLYLNVWAPRAEPEAIPSRSDRLPVMVWIHGGGNQRGHSGSNLYDGARLAGTEQVVVVSMNFRLGPFAFFSHPAIRSDASDALEASGNFGTLDLVRALEWVRANIEEFGGDPTNVTIFGESSGGQNVLALMLADGARGLFHRAIVQSGSTDSVSVSEAENPANHPQSGHPHSSAEIVVALLEEAGIVPDREAARGYAASLPSEDLAEFLRGRSAREIIDAYRDPDRTGSLDVPRLIRDGALLPQEDWNAAFRGGRFHKVPIILGSNRDEMKLNLFQDDEHVRARFGVLYRIRDVEDYERRARYHSDLWRVRGVTRPASAIVDSGATDVFAYRFDWDEMPSLFGTDLGVLLGAAHGFELPFVFGSFDLGNPLFNRLVFTEETRATREQLSATIMSYWSEFAHSGRPGRGRDGQLPLWAPWTSSGRGASDMATSIILDAESDGGIRLVESKLTRDHVIAAVDAEPGLGQEQKCDLFHDLFSNRPDWDPEDYRRIGRHGCAEYPRLARDSAGR